MSFVQLTKASWARPGASTRLLPPTLTSARSLSTSPFLAVANRASDSSVRKPQPTESEEDVKADRSPENPLHAGNYGREKQTAEPNGVHNKGKGKGKGKGDGRGKATVAK